MNELQCFVLEGHNIRGSLVRLHETWRHVVADHLYPRELQRLLGESVAATVLLASTLKDRPGISIQLQGDGRVSLLLVQCRASEPSRAGSGLRVRGMAQWRESRDGGVLLGGGRLAVNVERTGSAGLYQGIVPLVSDDLGASLEAYFRQSEQLPTHLLLHTANGSGTGSPTGGAVAGLLLQALPAGETDPIRFERAAALAQAVTSDELLTLEAEQLLPRLFSDHAIRLFDARPVVHDCRCTPAHLAGIVRLLGESELDALLADPGQVELNCEFCNRLFCYDRDGIAAVLRGEAPGTPLH